MFSQLALVALFGLTGVLACCGDDEPTPDATTAPAGKLYRCRTTTSEP